MTKKIEELYLPGQIICDQYACGLAPNCPCGEPHWPKDCSGTCPHEPLKACLSVKKVAEKVKEIEAEYDLPDDFRRIHKKNKTNQNR